MHRRTGFWAGVVAGACVTAGTLTASRSVVALLAREASAQPTYKIVLENDRVRVRDATFPPGVLDTPMHTHQYAHVGVILTKGRLTFTDPDGKQQTVEYSPGSVGFREAQATHRVANPGSAPMRVIEVEIK
jgi:quercetin dioxygenase-like cupin family protein